MENAKGSEQGAGGFDVRGAVEKWKGWILSIAPWDKGAGLLEVATKGR